MLPPQILGRIAAIQAELAGILAALPFTAQLPTGQPPVAGTVVAASPASPASPAAQASPAAPAEAPTSEPELPVAAAPTVVAPATPVEATVASTPVAEAPAKTPAEAPTEARWSFLPDARYRVVGENPFQPGANATRFDAIVARHGAEPFTFAELEALVRDIPGDAASSKAIVAMLQVAGRQRNTIVMAG